MNPSRLFAIGGVAVSVNTSTSARPSGLPDSNPSREVVSRFVELLYRRRQVRAAFESCVIATGFLDSDLEGPTGRQAAIEFVSRRFSDPNLSFRILDVLVDGERGVVRLAVNESGREHQRMDLFIVRGGRIVEHQSYVGGAPVASIV